MKIKQKLTDIMAERTGQDLERLKADMERDFYMSADDALAYGILDEVIPAKR